MVALERAADVLVCKRSSLGLRIIFRPLGIEKKHQSGSLGFAVKRDYIIIGNAQCCPAIRVEPF